MPESRGKVRPSDSRDKAIRPVLSPDALQPPAFIFGWGRWLGLFLRLLPGWLTAEEAARPLKKPNVGGQAVIEGVMMRGPERWSVTVRRPDGQMETRVVSYRGWAQKKPWLGKPFIRGSAVLFESLLVGLRALNFSAEIAAREEKPIPPQPPGDVPREPEALSALKAAEDGEMDQAPPDGGKKVPPVLGFWTVALTLAAAFGLAIGLFVALPHWLSWLAGNFWGFDDTSPLFHLIDGILKFFFFMTYIWGIGLMPDIKRVYAYHGAEHQAIYAFEKNEELTPANAARHPSWHPRCGTAFIFLVLALSILFFAAVFPFIFPSGGGGFLRGAAGVLLKILLMFPLAGLAYEVTRLAAKKGDGSIWKFMLLPGLWLQRLTTRRPDEAQLEVAIRALQKAVGPN